jgi:hypothetical protein
MNTGTFKARLLLHRYQSDFDICRILLVSNVHDVVPEKEG